jgi:hypothetical protein
VLDIYSQNHVLWTNSGCTDDEEEEERLGKRGLISFLPHFLLYPSAELKTQSAHNVTTAAVTSFMYCVVQILRRLGACSFPKYTFCDATGTLRSCS